MGLETCKTERCHFRRERHRRPGGAEQLLGDIHWRIVGVSRHRPEDLGATEHVACELADAASTQSALAGVPAIHVFFATWNRQANEKENCRVNGAMLDNALVATAGGGNVKHVCPCHRADLG